MKRQNDFEMIRIEDISREWKRDGVWRIAPAGLDR